MQHLVFQLLVKNTKFDSWRECYYRKCGLSMLRVEIWAINKLLAHKFWVIAKI
jgi:hypothetical protein